jgi:hypothetical protein
MERSAKAESAAETAAVEQQLNSVASQLEGEAAAGEICMGLWRWSPLWQRAGGPIFAWLHAGGAGEEGAVAGASGSLAEAGPSGSNGKRARTRAPALDAGALRLWRL